VSAVIYSAAINAGDVAVLAFDPCICTLWDVAGACSRWTGSDLTRDSSDELIRH